MSSRAESVSQQPRPPVVPTTPRLGTPGVHRLPIRFSQPNDVAALDWNRMAPTMALFGGTDDAGNGAVGLLGLREQATIAAGAQRTVFLTRGVGTTGGERDSRPPVAVPPPGARSTAGRLRVHPIRMADGSYAGDAALITHTPPSRPSGCVGSPADDRMPVHIGVMATLSGIVSGAALADPRDWSNWQTATQPGEEAAAAGHGVDERTAPLTRGWVGLLWRAEACWSGRTSLREFQHAGRRINLESLLRGGLRQAASRFRGPGRLQPGAFPHYGLQSLGAMTTELSLLFGMSPWALAAQCGSLSQGHPVLNLAAAVHEVLRAHGLLTPLGHAHDSDHAEKLLTALHRRLAEQPTVLESVMDQLANAYDLDFGSPLLRLMNEMRNRNWRTGLPKPRPADYAFVRAAFNGGLDWHDGIPPASPVPYGPAAAGTRKLATI